MSKKIIVLCCSPTQNGNTNMVAAWVAQGARETGAVVEFVDVAHLHYKTIGCTACMGCQKLDRYECVIADEATPVLARLPLYDVIIFATPVFMMGPTAQMKVFGDRMFSLFKFTPAGKYTHPFKKGSALGLITTSGAGKYVSGIKIVQKMFRYMAYFAGQKLHAFLVPNAGESGSIKTNEKVRKKAVAFGKKIGRE